MVKLVDLLQAISVWIHFHLETVIEVFRQIVVNNQVAPDVLYIALGLGERDQFDED